MKKNSKLTGFKKGATVTFTALRLTTGNPVKGELISEDDEWISVKLAHDCEGLVNTWYKGETKSFRETLISGLKALMIIIAVMLSSLRSFAQYDCENFPAATVSYVLPKTISAGVDYFTEKGFTAAIGAGYTKPKTFAVKQGANIFDSTGNAFDLYAYVGYRIARIDYSVSVFLNAGYTMGDKYEAKPVISSKILFPVNNHAFSVEPFYIFGRGFSGELSAHFRF